MAKKNERIESLRKEKLTNNFQKSGISTKFVDDFVIRLSKEISEYRIFELREKVLQSLQRQMRKHFEKMEAYEQLEQFLKEISFGSSKIEIKSLETMEDQMLCDYLVELLARCAKMKNNQSFTFDNYKDLFPIELKASYFSMDYRTVVEKEAYSLGKQKFTKRYHDGTWYLTRTEPKKSARIMDLAVLCSEIFLVNSIEQFTVKNKGLYLYKLTEELIDRQKHSIEAFNELPLPTEENSRKVILDTMNKYDLLPSHITLTDDEGLNDFAQHFILEADEDLSRILDYSMIINDTMLPEFLKQTFYIKDKVDRAVKETSDYARSFQTKKHINKSTQEVMEDNKFLSKYGYVEIDNDVNLKKFHQLEREFEALTKKIYVPECKDHSFRIKKLGKHRAAGIYYPEPVRATIFDLDYPDSYVHELGHQIDYVLGKEVMLSETIRFKRVAELYKKEVNKTVDEMSDDNEFKTVWKGKSKFNSSYYLQPTEIFARSFELYLWNKGIETSFLKKEYDGPVYPKSEDFLNVAQNYFEELFSFFEPDKEKKVEKKREQQLLLPLFLLLQRKKNQQTLNNYYYFK
ncbi:LPD1 domain-containing protein [Virgibacillus halodenitrificans]|uniref:LPD1 domain-containing protein n=1 Tax=Virgibacillus halodenitrificans TaxID=1482 RepID=UPI000EF543A6|nr:LPD1 domain-containing protein [Virgibacillus halodenitrificans]